MTAEERQEDLDSLDESLLKGCVVWSSWTEFLMRDCDTAFVQGAHLAAIITATSAIDAILRTDHASPNERIGLAAIVERSDLPADLRREIHDVRRYRNKWVHVADPWDGAMDAFMSNPEPLLAELELMALRAVTVLRKTFYWNQGV